MMLTKVEGPDAHGRKVYTFGTQHTFEVPQRYDVQELIGRGAYGLVCSAVDTTTGDTVAVKKISRLFEDAVDAKRLLREVKLLRFVDHANILHLKDLFKPVSAHTFSDLYLVTELMETDMQALLRSSRVRLKAGHCQYFTLQLLCALQYLHSANIVHRDIKPGNLLTNADCRLMLCDFGLARGVGTHMTHYVVTRWYRPPELLFVCKDYDCSVDVWAAGCLAAEMITGKPLLPGRDYIHQVNLTVELLGVPDLDTDMPSVPAEARQYLASLPPATAKPLHVFAPELRRRFDDIDFFDSFDDDDGGGNGDAEDEDKGNKKAAQHNNNTDDDDDGGGASSTDNNNKTIAQQQQQMTPAAYYALFEDFLFGMLRYNASKRLTARQAVAHPWLADVRGGQSEIAGCTSPRTYSWACEDKPLTIDELRSLFLDEISSFAAEHAPPSGRRS